MINAEVDMSYNENDAQIFVVTHKKFDMPFDDTLHKVLVVGDKMNDIPNGWLSDSNGISISEKNDRYNELTGIYWIWKNSKASIVGICHYRRYFTTPKGKILNLLTGKFPGPITEGYVKKCLKNHDVILHNKTFFKETCIKHVTLKTGESAVRNGKLPETVIKIAAETFVDMYPEHADIYEKVMNGKCAHLLNVMIAPKKLFDEYCEWIFPYLFETEKRINASFPGEPFCRSMGLIAERTLDVWVKIRGLKVKECFTVNSEQVDMELFAR